MPREQLTHSLVRAYSTDEEMFLRGKPTGDFRPQPYFLELEPVDPRGSVEVEDDLPFEWDRQHSCCHGSRLAERHEAALRGFGLAVVVCSLIVFWGAAFAALGAVARWLR